MNDYIDFFPENNGIIIDDLSNTFKHSIIINPEFKHDIEDVYKRMLLNIGKTNVSIFNFKYIQMFESFAKEDSENKELAEFSKSIIKHIDSYFKELDFCLNIKNKDDLDNLNYILKLSSIVLDDAIEEEDIDLAYESFFQVEQRIKKYTLYKDNVGENIKYLLLDFNSNVSFDQDLVDVTFKTNEQI